VTTDKDMRKDANNSIKCSGQRTDLNRL